MDRNDKPYTEWKTGDEPPFGVYICLECGGFNPHTVTVPHDCEKLPVCPVW